MTTVDPAVSFHTRLPAIDDHLDDARDELEELVRRTGIPGAQLGITDGDQTWTVCAGVQDLKSGTPMTASTRFSFASLTKTVTATLAMTLVDEGRLDLQAPPTEYLPGLRLPRHPDAHRDVTLADLLSHTSGLSGFFDADDDETPEQCVRRCIGEMSALAAPGTAYSLNNSAYLVAAACIDRVTGGDWHDEVVSRVLEPVGARTATTDRAVVTRGAIARGHVRNRAGAPLVLPVPLAPRALAATASVFGTVSDALAVARDHLRAAGTARRVLSQEAVDALDVARVDVTDPYWDAASIGWLNSSWGADVLDSRGADGGQETILRCAPTHGRGLALFANSWTRRWPYFDVLPRTSETLLGVHAPVVDDAALPRATDPRLIGAYRWESVEFCVAADLDGALHLSSRNAGARGGLFIELDRLALHEFGTDLCVFRMPNVELPVGIGFSRPDAHGRPTLANLLQRTARRTS